MGIELTGCPDCDKSLQEKKDLCSKHRLEMIGNQIEFWCKKACETIEELKQKKEKEDAN